MSRAKNGEGSDILTWKTKVHSIGIFSGVLSWLGVEKVLKESGLEGRVSGSH